MLYYKCLVLNCRYTNITFQHDLVSIFKHKGGLSNLLNGVGNFHILTPFPELLSVLLILLHTAEKELSNKIKNIFVALLIAEILRYIDWEHFWQFMKKNSSRNLCYSYISSTNYILMTTPTFFFSPQFCHKLINLRFYAQSLSCLFLWGWTQNSELRIISELTALIRSHIWVQYIMPDTWCQKDHKHHYSIWYGFLLTFLTPCPPQMSKLHSG